MPTYENRRQGRLYLEHRRNDNTGVNEAREIAPGALFAALSTDIPAAWLAGSELEGGPYVVKVSDDPSDEEILRTGRR